MLLMNTSFNEDNNIPNNRNFIKIEDEFGTVFRKESMNVDPNRSTFVKTKLEYRPNTGQIIMKTFIVYIYLLHVSIL